MSRSFQDEGCCLTGRFLRMPRDKLDSLGLPIQNHARDRATPVSSLEQLMPRYVSVGGSACIKHLTRPATQCAVP